MFHDADVRTLPVLFHQVPLVHLAAAANNKALYKLLLEHGCTPLTEVDALGRSALHYAAAKGSADLAEELIGCGLKPDQLDKQRNTPLHLAGARGRGCSVYQCRG